MRPQSLLRLLQISDSAFPTGAFAHSLGLEAFFEAGELAGPEDLERAVGLHLDAAATSDCVALRAAYAADTLEELTSLDRLLSATKLTKELRAASAATGRRFLASVLAGVLAGVGALDLEEGGLLDEFSGLVRGGGSPGNLAVGYGVVAPHLGAGLEEVLSAYLYSTAAALVAAGQKLIPLGGSVAQRVLHGLGGEILLAVEKSASLEAGDMYAFTPLLDVRSMHHERQRTRLYIS